MRKERELLKKIRESRLRREILEKNLFEKKQNKKITNNKPKRPLKINLNKKQSAAFITGGIGDVITIECFLTDAQRNELSTIYYATNKHTFVESLFKSLDCFPKLKNHVKLWQDFSNFWAFYYLEDFIIKSKFKNKKIFEDCLDLSIFPFFQKIKKEKIPYNGCSFLEKKLTNIEHIDLPNEYIVIAPCSTDKRLLGRDFNHKDWEQTNNFLKKHDLKGVILYEGKDVLPECKNIKNLQNKTSILESIEILKGAKGYIGIDSWISVLASKLFEEPYLQIKSINSHCYENAEVYYAPKTKFNFIVKEIISK